MTQDSNITNAVISAKQGDENAFAVLYNASYRMVYQICLGHLKNSDDAEDATQEVFITTFKKLSMLQDNNTYFGWIKTIAVRTCLNILDVKKNRINISYDDAIQSEEILEGDDNLETLSDTYVMRSEKRKIVLDILKNQLSEIQYQTIFMYYFDGMSVEQIAAAMRCSENTVKTRLKNSRVKIKAGIEEYEKKTGDKLANGAGTIPFLTALFNAQLSSTPIRVLPFAGLNPGPNAVNLANKAPTIPTSTGINNPIGNITRAASETKPYVIATKAGMAKSVVVKAVTSVVALFVVGGAAIKLTSMMKDTKSISKSSEETHATESIGIEIEFEEVQIPEITLATTETNIEETEIILEPIILSDYIFMQDVPITYDRYDYTTNSFIPFTQTVSVPQLTLCNEEVANSINEEIIDSVTYGLSSDYLLGCGFYAWTNSDTVFTLIIENYVEADCDYANCYTIDTTTGTILSGIEILNLGGYTEDQLLPLGVNAIQNRMEQIVPNENVFIDGELNPNCQFSSMILNKPDYADENWLLSAYNKSISTDNINLDMKMFLDKDLNLCFITDVVMIGGAGVFELVLTQDGTDLGYPYTGYTEFSCQIESNFYDTSVPPQIIVNYN